MALCQKDQSLTRCLLCFKNNGPQNNFSYSTILNSFFYAYSAIVDSFAIVSFFEKHYIAQYYRRLTCVLV